MIICCAFFSQNGRKKAQELSEALAEIDWECRGEGETLHEFTGRAFRYHLPILFIGAAGIAVRAIAPFVRDKLTDSPVLVMDEAGRFVVPILSGHAGGAGDLAVLISHALRAEPVITTATDVENVFSCDVFARRNFLFIRNRDGIRRVSEKLLSEGKITACVQEGIRLPDEEPPACLELVRDEGADVLVSDRPSVSCSLWLSPQPFFLGIGCRKGKSFEELLAFADRKFVRGRWDRVAGIASIDRKRHERGLEILAQYEHIPFFTFSAGELEKAEGMFSSSGFVKRAVGVSNVCERAAVLAAGEGAELVLSKTAEDGMTLAAARAVPCIRTWNTDPGVCEGEMK